MSVWQNVATFLEQVLPTGRQVLDFWHVIFSFTFDFLLFILITITSIYVIIALFVVLTHKKYMSKNKELPRVPDEKVPFVTIQIPTYNELAALECARRCLAFDYPKDKYEILIGDDSNQKEISAQIAAFANEHEQVTVFKRKKNVGFKPGNLNNLLPHSKGDYILIFDSDFTPQKDFLRRIVAPAVADPTLGAVQARWTVSNSSQNLTTILGTAGTNAFHLIILPFIQRFSPTVNLCGTAELVRKDKLIELGGWKTGALTEDIEYTFRMITNNLTVKYVPTLECDNEVPYRAQDLFKQQMRWAYGVCSAFMLHGKNIFSLKQSWRIWLMVIVFGFGYLVTSLMALLTIFGTLSIITHPPEAIQWGAFASKTAFNFAVTSGLFILTMAGAYLVGSKKTHFVKLVIASYSIGFIVLFYVAKGIYKAITRQPMHWFMLQKNGNLKA